MATEQSQLKTPNVQDTLTNLGQNKQMVLIGAGVVTLILTLVIVFFVWNQNATNKGEEIDLVKRINQDRAFEIVTKLKANDLNATIADSDLPGKVNVKVFEKDFDKAALTIAKSDLLQEDGFNIFDKSDWAASDYDKRVKMMRAVNGDISRILSRMAGIKWATARVNIPEPQLFSQYQAPTTATVQIETTDDSGKLSRSQVRSVINLLVGYVPNLQKNNISIIDTNGETYSSVETDDVAASDILEESEKVNKVVQKRIEEYLVPLLGSNNFIVRVSSEISRKKIEESATTFAEGVVGQEQIGDERLGGNGSNITPDAPGADPSMSYTRTNRVTQKYPSFKQKTISTPAGRVTKISVALALNRDLISKVSLKQLREGIAAITSPTTTTEDIKITVAEFATEKPQRIVSSKPLSIPNISEYISRLNIQKMPSWVGIAAAVLGFLIIINAFKPSSNTRQSTVAQINQGGIARNQQFQQNNFEPQQLQDNQYPQIQSQAQSPPQISQFEQQSQPQQTQEKQADFSGLLSGLQEAATEKPEVLANKLQMWLEDGSTTRT